MRTCLGVVVAGVIFTLATGISPMTVFWGTYHTVRNAAAAAGMR
jgi:hypothetical protein